MKPWRGGLAAMAALVLAGCVVSEKPLFDPLSAVTPVAAGRYEQQELRDGKWVTLRAGSLGLAGRTYEWKPDGEKDAPRFTVHEAGSEYFTLYALVTDGGKTKHYYALIKPTPEGILFYQPLCSDFRKLNLRGGLRPTKIVESDCYYEDDAALSAALIAHAKALPPEFRYVRVGELAAPPGTPAPRPGKLRALPSAAKTFPFIGSPGLPSAPPPPDLRP